MLSQKSYQHDEADEKNQNESFACQGNQKAAFSKKKGALKDVSGRTRKVVSFEDGILLPGYRLPTEAEWEKAASISTDNARQLFTWGDAAPDVSLKSDRFKASRLRTWRLVRTLAPVCPFTLSIRIRALVTAKILCQHSSGRSRAPG